MKVVTTQPSGLVITLDNDTFKGKLHHFWLAHSRLIWYSVYIRE